MSYTSPRRTVTALPDDAYRDANGLVLICMYCHRTHIPGSDQWDWVEAYAAAPPLRASHGLCRACLKAACASQSRSGILVKREAEMRPARGDVQAIKETIQGFAYRLWFEKRNTVEGVEWLVDGRFRTQLDELSKSQLLRIERLLVNPVRMLPREPDMTARSG